MGTAVATPGLGTEAVELLGELISLDTVNPPGNEDRAQELLETRLSAAGFECELLSAEPGRPNLIARLAGEAEGETLCLLGHVDTVPANSDEWSFSPWAGDVVDGMVRGRGAQDMKGQVACEAAAAIHLAASGWRPERGELKLVFTADEEAGAAAGAQWLCSEHAEKVRADLVVNEGGGPSFEFAGKRFYPLCVGEKGVCRFRLRARGVAGHGSIPGLGDNALLRLAPALSRFAEQPPLEAHEAGMTFLSRLLGEEIESEHAALESAVERVRSQSPLLAAYVAEPMLRVTMVPTKVRASEKDNVIPSLAEALIDTRVPPGQGPDDAHERAVALLGPLAEGLEIDFVDRVVGNSSPFETPFADTIAAWLDKSDPDATLVPIVMPGFSDSHWFRKAFPEATVYGFHPARTLSLFESTPLIHSADELAAVADIELAASFYADLIHRVLG
jgi:acetylornithine deacetylase/succinyl-diaminopimelate desuccinylase-like protein